MFISQKKALHALKAPKQEPEPLVPLKRPMEAKDAKEMAKKLIKSGAIKVPERPQAATEKTTFKRSMVRDYCHHQDHFNKCCKEIIFKGPMPSPSFKL